MILGSRSCHAGISRSGVIEGPMQSQKRQLGLQILAASCFVLCALALGACERIRASDVDTRVSSLGKSFEGSDKAIILMSAELVRHTNLFTLNQSVDITFQIKKPVSSTVENGKTVARRYLRTASVGTTRLYVVDPGEYAVLRMAHGNTWYLPSAGWDSRTGKPLVFGFQVQPSEVLYLGHLHVENNPKHAYAALMRVDDRHEEAQGVIRQEFGYEADPILARLETRLLDVPPQAW